MRQKVANYPGVTVERKEGVWRLNGSKNAARLIDLPGLYSLDALSLDEQIAHEVLTGKMNGLPKPDVVVAVVDATNLGKKSLSRHPTSRISNSGHHCSDDD